MLIFLPRNSVLTTETITTRRNGRRRCCRVGGEESSRLRLHSSREGRQHDGVSNEGCRCSIGRGDHLSSRRWFRAQSLEDTRLSQPFVRMKKDTYYRFCRLKMPCVGVLNFEPANIILKNKGESAIIYPRRVNVCSFPLRHAEKETHRNVLQCGPGRPPSTARS